MRRTKLGVVLVLALLVAAGVAPAAVPPDSSALRNAVNSAGIMKHENQFQKIANLNDGTRAASTPGYDASAKYVADKLRSAGYRVTEQPFEFPYFEETGPSTFERLTPLPAETYVRGTDLDLMEYSGAGGVTGQVVPTNDIVIPPGAQAGTSNSGCEVSDFLAATAGNAGKPVWPSPREEPFRNSVSDGVVPNRPWTALRAGRQLENTEHHGFA